MDPPAQRGARSKIRIFRMPAHCSAKLATSPHMPPPMTTTSCTGRPSVAGAWRYPVGGRQAQACEIVANALFKLQQGLWPCQFGETARSSSLIQDHGGGGRPPAQPNILTRNGFAFSRINKGIQPAAIVDLYDHRRVVALEHALPDLAGETVRTWRGRKLKASGRTTIRTGSPCFGHARSALRRPACRSRSVRCAARPRRPLWPAAGWRRR